MQHAAALFHAGRLPEAQAVCLQVLHLREGRDFNAWHLLAVIAARGGDPAESVRFATRALEIEPGHVEALCNRGAALRMLHRHEDALADYDRALAIAPGSAVALNNRGVALAALNRHREALESFDRALALRPDYPQAHYSRAISRLMLGDFAGGWDDHEWRWTGSENAELPRPFPVPMFGADDWGRGHRVALWSEQGVGDQLLFCTLVPEMAARGEDFVLEVDGRLLPAFARTHPAWKLVARGAAGGFADCDRHLPIGSLARLLRRSRASFARQPRALLSPDETRSADLRRRLASPGKRLVGISWRSFQPPARRYYEGRKNAPLEAFRALSTEPALRLVDLQYGDTAAERQAFERSGGRLARIEGLDLFADLDGVLAAIGACDAVVTTSNVTAHLAGCAGKPTLLMYLSANPAFHYWVPGEDGRALWHPSVQIVTSPALDTWPKVFAEVAARLAAGFGAGGTPGVEWRPSPAPI